MGILFMLVPLSMIVLAILIWAAFWAIRNNQYEDMEGPAHRILMDDDDPRIPQNAQKVAEAEAAKSAAPKPESHA